MRRLQLPQSPNKDGTKMDDVLRLIDSYGLEFTYDPSDDSHIRLMVSKPTRDDVKWDVEWTHHKLSLVEYQHRTDYYAIVSCIDGGVPADAHILCNGVEYKIHVYLAMRRHFALLKLLIDEEIFTFSDCGVTLNDMIEYLDYDEYNAATICALVDELCKHDDTDTGAKVVKWLTGSTYAEENSLTIVSKISCDCLNIVRAVFAHTALHLTTTGMYVYVVMIALLRASRDDTPDSESLALLRQWDELGNHIHGNTNMEAISQKLQLLFASEFLHFKSRKQTPLHIAAKLGLSTLVSSLISSNASINAKDQHPSSSCCSRPAS
jgi:hypothetical protein